MVVASIGVIGGSGIYSMAGIRVIREIEVDTPFGKPSDKYILADVSGVLVVFLPRHGRGHLYNPSEVNYRANIFGMKLLGVKWLLAVSAVGSLREEIVPGQVVLVDQFIDRTSKRSSTFFEGGIVGHVPFSHPVCSTLHSLLKASCKELGTAFHERGTYVNMEGPAFSTVAESFLYRSWHADVIGMTAMTEAKLAREAEISYGLLAMATDYDCWRPDTHAVTVDAVVAVLHANASTAQSLIRHCVGLIAKYTDVEPAAWNCLRTAIMTSPERIPVETFRRLAPILKKYFPDQVAAADPNTVTFDL